MTQLRADICNYVAKMTAKWIIDGGLEQEWDQYVSTLKKMGSDRYVKIHSDAYARFAKK